MLSVVPTNSLLCNECECDQGDASSCVCNTPSDFDDDTYCVIIEERYVGATYVELTRIPRNSTWIYIEDPYYILTQESIRYNQSSGDWYLWTNGIVHGCDWDLCNSVDLINLLPNSFQLTVDKTWLNTNIYGTGNVTDCNVCSAETCGNTSSPIDVTQCPLTPCLNATTCLVYDLWNNIATGEQCYQSQCAPAYLDTPSGQASGGKYRLDIEAIIYLAQDRSKFDVWEIDVYCGASNCSRPTIFQEIVQQLTGNISDLSAFPTTRPTTTPAPPTTTTPLSNPLKCYSCECFDEDPCPCSSTTVTSLDYTYCVIIREIYGQEVFTYLDYLDMFATYIYIREFPYALIEEQIAYDEGVGRWFTSTNFIIYGCNWNLCNKPDLIPLLPNSYQMRLPEAWLNSSILGTGQPVRDCHECPDEVQCGTLEFLDASKCPIQPCNTTCLVVDSFDDPAFEYLCYQSFCLPPDTPDYEFERHLVEIEGIIYASQPSVVELWEIDIYCRADDCSRPQIFKELREQLRVQPGTLSSLFNETHDPTIPQRRCYDCYCYDDPNCGCNKTTIMSANLTYCTILREDYGQDVWVSMQHVDQDSTRVHIRQFPYLIAEESITYSEQTGRWTTRTNAVIYGCDWDYCNDPRLVPYLPSSFQMRLPEAWLNSSILGTGQPVRDCHECPEAPQCGTTDFLDASRCPVESCNTTCLVFDTFNNPADDLQCYQSFCAPPDSEFFEVDSHRVEIEGILYLNKPSREVEIWEIDVYCRADDCSRPELFTELKAQLSVVVGDLSVIEANGQSTMVPPTTTSQTTTSQTVSQTTTTSPMTTTTTSQTTSTTTSQTTTTTTSQSMTTTTSQTTTTTSGSTASIFTNMNLLSILLMMVLLFNFH